VIFKNSMKRALQDGNVVFGPMVSEIRSPGIALLFAQSGFDFFFIDLEHSCPQVANRPKIFQDHLILGLQVF
jgi:2-keto-3-deoxy-L-rhamnonate aldolase RhmA